MNKRSFLLCLLILPGFFSLTAQQRTGVLYGKVYDKDSQESLIGVNIRVLNHKEGTSTNAFGQYSLWLPGACDTLVVEASYLGYQTQQLKLLCLEGNQEYTWVLERDIYGLDEFIVSANRNERALEKPLSTFQVNMIELNTMPSLSGEKDLLKHFQYTPGVQLAGDFNSNLYVRGGDYDQNLFLLDDMPLYHVSHLGGVLSTFNPDIIKSATILKGGFPARYGGRLSSVVDVHTKDGDMNKHQLHGTLGLISSKLCVHGPIAREKSSYLVSARKNTIPLHWFSAIDLQYAFYDVNMKLNTLFPNDDRLFFSFYSGFDKLKLAVQEEETINSLMKTGWGNTAGSLRYNKRISPKLHTHMILGGTQYQYIEETKAELEGGESGPISLFTDFRSEIREYFGKLHIDMNISRYLQLFTGYDYAYIMYTPGVSDIKQSGGVNTIDETRGYPSSDAHDHQLFFELDIKGLYGFACNAGIRFQHLMISDYAYSAPQPRILISRKISRNTAIKASYAGMSQHFHMLENNGGGAPVAYRIPAMKLAPPSESKQLVLGGNYTSTSGEYEIILEGFHRSLSNLVTLLQGTYFTMDFKEWEHMIYTDGVGESHGIELMLRKSKGTTTGWIAGTLSQTTRQFAEINNGESYPFRYDRRFDLKLFFQQKLGEKSSFSASWAFGTGNAYTLPQSQYRYHEGHVIFIYGEHNSSREKPYHRLDIAWQYAWALQRIQGTFDISILNLYNRKNPYYYFTRMEMDSPVLYQQSQFPFLPSLSISFQL